MKVIEGKAVEPEALFPGEELVKQGLLDLSQGNIDDCSLLVLIAAPRLKRLGIQVPERPFHRSCEHQLCERLEQRLGAGAHSGTRTEPGLRSIICRYQYHQKSV